MEIKPSSVCSGLGLFAKESIKPHTFIGYYSGEWLITSEESQIDIYNKLIDSSYLFNLKVANFSVLDAERFGNHTRFINHMPEALSNVKVSESHTHKGIFLVFETSKTVS